MRTKIVVVCVLAGIGLMFGILSNSVQDHIPLFVSHAGIPVHLVIPTIGLDAPIEQVGLTLDGAMDVPKVQGNVGWYELGPRPGDSGSAVVDGHYGILKNGTPSVFDHLNQLRAGDRIQVIDDKGSVINFLVHQIRNYDPEADATDVFSSDDGKDHLNLITCEGIWNEAAKNYSQRLVVFTEKE